MTPEIRFQGRRWRLHQSSAARLVFLPAGRSAVLIWREHAGLNQRDAAAQLGISQPTLQRIETGQRAADDAVLSRLTELMKT